MARVLPLETAKDIADIAAGDPFDDANSDEEATCISSPLRVVPQDSDEESTRHYEDLPTRVMDTSPTSGVVSRNSSPTFAPPAVAQRPTVPAPGEMAAMAAQPANQHTLASVVVRDSSHTGRTPSTMLLAPPDTRGLGPGGTSPGANVLPRTERLNADRALLREITGAGAAYSLPVIAVRQAPPTASFLLVVAGFTALGMLWVIAVVAMILSLVIH